MSYILSFDSGSTGIRAMLFNREGKIVAREYQKTPAMNPKSGWIEHDPEVLWQALLSVGKKLFAEAKCTPKDVVAAGLCNQRASFALWEKTTGKPVTNFINWADVRASETCKAMNENPKWKRLQMLAKASTKLISNPMMMTASMLSFTTDHVTVRLKWALDDIPGLRERCKKGEILFGTLDTWFIYKLTKGKMHVTDYTNAATGMLDPFHLEWNERILNIFEIPLNILPVLKNNLDELGTIDACWFGVPIPICASAGDQSAALFGQCCHEAGDVKISQGSGAFVDMNVGHKPKLSKRGLFPLIGWVIDQNPTYMLEGYVATAGTLIDWLGKGLGLSDTPQVLNELAGKVDDTEGVIFMPTISGIRFPYFNPKMRASIIGLSLNTHRGHVARAVLEGIALRLYDIIEGLEEDTEITIKKIRTDGGVSKSDILMQMIADFTNLEIKRAPEADMTSTGTAYMAGLSVGFWKDFDELRKINEKLQYTVYTPNMDSVKRDIKIKRWKKAIKAVITIDE